MISEINKKPQKIIDFKGLFLFCTLQDSNLRPFGPEPNALSPELRVRRRRSSRRPLYCNVYFTSKIRKCQTFPHLFFIFIKTANMPLRITCIPAASRHGSSPSPPQQCAGLPLQFLRRPAGNSPIQAGHTPQSCRLHRFPADSRPSR